jgi:hypothetical protein
MTGVPIWSARQYWVARCSTSIARARAFATVSPKAMMPWLASKQARRPWRAATALRDSSGVPKVAYLAQRMSSPPAAATM